MDYKRFGQKIVLILKKGDKINESIKELAKKEDIKACHFAGIGAVSKAQVGLFRPGADDYEWNYFEDDLEVTSLLGNVSIFEGEPLVHSHITLSDSESKVWGGHLGEATVSFTMEIFVDLIDGQLDKVKDPEAGVNLIKL